MGKKHEKKGKKKVILSLAEFNEDAGLGGVDPTLAALPTAPKGADEWEAQGGRPEYNSRGYKERSSAAYKDRGYDDGFDDRDWSRRGPLEEQGGSSEFGGGADRDWGGMRRGPLESDKDTPQERDWNDMRRQPVDSSFRADNVPERDWGVRKGPIESEAPARVLGDADWGSARRTPIEAELPQAKVSEDRDWSVRKPMEAETAAKIRDTDWSAPRKGPIEVQPVNVEPEKDWTIRKGPVDAESPKLAMEADWTDARKGPLEPAAPKRDEEEVDWMRRRGPLDVEMKEKESREKQARPVDFSEVRRGARLQESPEKDLTTPPKSSAPDRREQWRRDDLSPVQDEGSREESGQQSPATPGDANPKERDWSAARRGHPMEANPRFARRRGSSGRDLGTSDPNATTTDANAPPEVDGVDNDDWTTVRSAARRRPIGRRSGGRGGTREKGAPARFQDSRVTSSSIGDGSKVVTASPVTPVTSTISES